MQGGGNTCQARTAWRVIHVPQLKIAAMILSPSSRSNLRTGAWKHDSVGTSSTIDLPADP
jgi:hypothetical protein